MNIFYNNIVKVLYFSIKTRELYFSCNLGLVWILWVLFVKGFTQSVLWLDTLWGPVFVTAPGFQPFSTYNKEGGLLSILSASMISGNIITDFSWEKTS